jgi:hypothetical protein
MFIFNKIKGDIGIVPRENEKILTNFEKMKTLNPQRELNNLQKVIKKSVSTQTIDFVKVTFIELRNDYSLLSREKTCN